MLLIDEAGAKHVFSVCGSGNAKNASLTAWGVWLGRTEPNPGYILILEGLALCSPGGSAAPRTPVLSD